MVPEDFTMWLRGVLDSVGEGNPIPAEVAQTLYSKLSEVVAGQVANRLLKADAPDELEMKQHEMMLAQQRLQMEWELKRAELERRYPPTYTTTGTCLKAVG
jgi:hypothetical protein